MRKSGAKSMTGSTRALLANEGLSSPGVKLHGAGFILTPLEAEHLGLGRRPSLENHIRPYRNGRDLTARPRDVLVIDLDGLAIDEVRRRFPEVYQHILVKVKPERDLNNEEYRRINWWLFGRRNTLMRSFVADLDRYIVTGETAKHRMFQFLDASILPDNMLVAIGSDDASVLGTLISRFHCVWTAAQGGTLEDRPRYTKSKCFDPFPFPAADECQKKCIGAIAEELDSHRKRVLAEHPHLTLTGLYNVLELLHAGTLPDDLEAALRRVFDDGLVLILKELHDSLDVAVADAYGWPARLTDNEILARLVALNRERVGEEAAGEVRWLRPEYQIPRFGTERDKLALTGGTIRHADEVQVTGPKPSFPASELEQAAAVMVLLNTAVEPLSAAGLAAHFCQGRRVQPQIEAALYAMLRVGGLVHSRDGGQSFAARRAA